MEPLTPEETLQLEILTRLSALEQGLNMALLQIEAMRSPTKSASCDCYWHIKAEQKCDGPSVAGE